MDRIEAHRLFFAKLITAQAGVAPGSELESAFISTPRERFVSQPPWRVFTRSGYIETPSDDPAFVYQDIVISLRGEGTVNNGQPTLHAACINALAPKKGNGSFISAPAQATTRAFLPSSLDERAQLMLMRSK